MLYQEQEFQCVYGSGHTRDTAYTYDGWYAVHGSLNVNRTGDLLHLDLDTQCVDVEELSDYDAFTVLEPITSLQQLINEVDEVDEYVNEDNEIYSF